MKKILITMAAAAFATAGFAQTTAFDGITGNNGIYGITFGTGIYANMYGEDITTPSPITITSMNVDLVSEAAVSYTDLQCVVDIYSTYTGATTGSTPEFSGLLSSSTEDFGAQSLAAGSYYAITGLTLNAAAVTGTSFGITVAWLANTGSGLTGAADLETGTTITAPTVGANALTATEFFAVGGTSSTSLTGGTSWGIGEPYTNMAIQLTGTATPEPASMAFLGLGIVGIIARRRRSSK